MRKEEEDKGGRKRWGWLVGWLGRWLVGWRGKETGGCQVARLSRSQNCQEVN